MAKLLKTNPTPPKDPPWETAHLELTYEEALFLYDVLSHVGGSPTHSRRQYQGGIFIALAGALSENDTHRSACDISHGHPGIYFDSATPRIIKR